MSVIQDGDQLRREVLEAGHQHRILRLEKLEIFQEMATRLGHGDGRDAKSPEAPGRQLGQDSRGATGEDKDPLATKQDFHGAIETLDRLREHLNANEVDLQVDLPILGPLLTIDQQTETISALHGAGVSVGLEDANRLVRGSYREPFVVPERV